MKTIGQKMGEMSQKKYRERIGDEEYKKVKLELSKKGAEARRKKVNELGKTHFYGDGCKPPHRCSKCKPDYSGAVCKVCNCEIEK